MTRMLQPARFAMVVLALTLAGCANPPRTRPFKVAPGDLPPDVDLRPPTAPAPVTRHPIQSKPVTHPATAVVGQSLSVPAATWVPLDQWARVNHFGPLTNLHSTVMPTFSLATPAGDFVVRVGSTLAQFAGLELRLGFEPRLVNDEPALHTLDLQKNLLPLLSGTSAPPAGPHVIVIDPGHGGKDSGTRSATGHAEKDYTLDWANRLADLLTARGWQVFLTRTNDADESLSNRVAFADEHHADLFVSLHFNAAGSAVHNGVETYCVTPTGMPSSVTRGYEDNPALAFPNNEFDAQNLQLALRIHREILAATKAEDRGIRHARFLSVLRAQHRPAVLIEGGYLSNPEEAALIDAPEHRQLLAEAVAKALQQP